MMGPLQLFDPAGLNAQHIAPLMWGLILLSIGVVVLVIIAVGLGLLLRTRGHPPAAKVVTEESRPGLWWVYGATGVSTLVLVVFIGWTLVTMAGTAVPPTPAAFSIDVNGAQWWWRFTYQAEGDVPGFATANELHIPVGVPVRVSDHGRRRDP